MRVGWALMIEVWEELKSAPHCNLALHTVHPVLVNQACVEPIDGDVGKSKSM